MREKSWRGEERRDVGRIRNERRGEGGRRGLER